MRRPLSEIHLKPGISATPSERGLVVAHPDGERYYRFSEQEYLLATLIHNHRDYEALEGEYRRRTGRKMDQAELDQFILTLEEFDLLEGASRVVPQAKPTLARLSRIMLPLHRPDAMLDRLQPLSMVLFAREFVAIALLMILITLTYTWGHRPEFGAILTTKALPSVTKLGLTWLAAILMGIAHEYGHGLACNYYGAKVPKMGVMLYWLVPMFYCDTSDAHRLKRRERIIVSLSGLYLQGFIAAFALFFLMTLPLSEGGRYLLAQLVVLGSLIAWVNLIPLVKLDGYYILGDLLGIDNLREKALSKVAAWVKAPKRPEKENRFFLFYGFLAILASLGMAISGLYWGFRLLLSLFRG